jgi:hypothetical protein
MSKIDIITGTVNPSGIIRKINELIITINEDEEIQDGELTPTAIKSKYESNADTNAFTDAEKTNLGNQSGTNTGDMSDADVKTAYENNADTNVLNDIEKSNLGLAIFGDTSITGMRFMPQTRYDALDTPLELDALKLERDIDGVAVSADVSDEDSSPHDVVLTPDGTKAFMLGQVSDSIHEYNLATPYDLKTMTPTGNSLYVGGEDNQPRGIYLRADGLKLFMIGLNTDAVYAYTFSSAFDITTLSYDSVSTAVGDTAPTDVTFNPAGTIMLVTGNAANAVLRYNLGTAWDLTTISALISSQPITEETALQGIQMDSTGLKMFLCGQTADAIHQFTLAVAFDPTTETFDKSLDVSGTNPSITGLHMRSNGEQFYTVGASADAVFSYVMDELVATEVMFTETKLYLGSTAYI